MSELKDHFSHALVPEPPFETDLTAALDAAVRGGRRRRARAVASQGLALVACAVIIGGAVVAIRPGGSSAPGATVLGSASSAPMDSVDPCVDPARVEGLRAVTGQTARTAQLQRVDGAEPVALPSAPTPAEKAALAEASADELRRADVEATQIKELAAADEPTPGPSAPDCWDGLMQGGTPLIRADVPDKVLTALVRAVAAAGGGTVSTQSPGFATVQTDSGTYSVDVTVWAQQYDPQEWIDSCSPSKGDAKPCTVEGSSARDLVRSLRFTDGSGRASLQYFAAAGTGADGRPSTVEVTIDNYVEQTGGLKTVGPSWKDLGLTRAAIRAAVDSTGALS